MAASHMLALQATDIATLFPGRHSMPATSQSGESWEADAHGAPDQDLQRRAPPLTGLSKSLDRHSFQNRGIFKKTGTKPRKRVCH